MKNSDDLLKELENISLEETSSKGFYFNFWFIICFSILFILIMFVLLFFVVRRQSKKTSAILPIIFDPKEERFRISDIQFEKGIREIFSKKEIELGQWISKKKFLSFISPKDRNAFETNLRTWEKNKLDIRLIHFIGNKRVDKFYEVFFSDPNQAERMIIILINDFKKTNKKKATKTSKINKKKLRAINDFKADSKTHNLYFAFEFKIEYSTTASQIIALNKFFKQNRYLARKVHNIILDDDTVILHYHFATDFQSLVFKKYFIKKIFKFKNYFFFDHFAIVYEELRGTLSNESRVKRKTSFALWKTKEENTAFEFLGPAYVNVDEYEKFIKNLDEVKKLMSKETIPLMAIPIFKNKKEVSILYKLDVDKQIADFINDANYEDLENSLFERHGKQFEKNSFAFIGERLFFDKIGDNVKFNSNVIVKSKNYKYFLYRYKKLENQISTYNNWGLSIVERDINILTIIQRTNLSFLFISSELTKRVKESEVFIFLETISNICKSKNIVIFYESPLRNVEPKIKNALNIEYFYEPNIKI